MDTHYQLNNVSFQWDSRKAAFNFSKHGVEFEIASEAFFDPMLQAKDGGISDGELRDALVGLTANWQLLYVVYIMRDDDIIRIISARPASKAERNDYEHQ